MMRKSRMPRLMRFIPGALLRPWFMGPFLRRLGREGSPAHVEPEKLKAALSVEDFCRTAEQYWAGIQSPGFHMAKPFARVEDAPAYLQSLGLLLDGLRLGRGMSVLDFGSGSCWLSRVLCGMGMEAIAVDASPSALEVGRRLFREHPPLGDAIAEPRFVPFDGRRLDVEDASCDRVAVFDAFHHVPNQEEVLAEFHRVLKPGGIAGLSEPGMFHSLSDKSQSEMRRFRVLEDDVAPDRIWSMAREAGFSDMYAKLISSPEMDLDFREQMKLVYKGKLSRRLKNHIIVSMQNQNVVFLQKGEYVPDSRRPEGLMHAMRAGRAEYSVRRGEPFAVDFGISNTGTSRWLSASRLDIGAVRVGAHLMDVKGKMLSHDFLRAVLDRDVEPGQSISKTVEAALPEPGRFVLEFDMVSEHICWFADQGAGTVKVSITVA